MDGKSDLRANRRGIAVERVERRIQVNAVFMPADRGAIHAAPLGHPSQTQSLRFAMLLKSREHCQNFELPQELAGGDDGQSKVDEDACFQGLFRSRDDERVTIADEVIDQPFQLELRCDTTRSAVRLLQMRTAACEMLCAVRRIPASRPLTIREFVRQLAGLGGHLLRKCDGEPGWITLWRGYEKLQFLLRGANAATKRCG